MEQAEKQPDQRCHHCGTALTGETSGGLCPRCLLEMNFASRTMPGGEASPQLPPPSPEEIAARFPQFEILECLGRGGMGIVYKARQKALDRLVAIKVLAGERHDDPQFEARFSREARTLAKLSHPNIVTVHDFGESDGMFYLVMEFVDGVNLRDVLRDGRMEPAQALAIVPSICEALQFAHDHGVVHRDIKPENILMDRDGRIKIADFGIATLVGAAAERSGTPPYMAPEQEAADGAIDHRADIYALGVVFYEMLTGERPEQDPSRPSQRVEIDVRLDEIVLRALEKEPEQRYQTAGEFRTVVETMASDRGTPVAAPAPAPTPLKPVDPSHGRSQPMAAALLLFSSVLGLGIFGYLTCVLPRLIEPYIAQRVELPMTMRWIHAWGGIASRYALLLGPLLLLATGGAFVWLFLSATRPLRQPAPTRELGEACQRTVRKVWGFGLASLCLVFGALLWGGQALRVSASGATSNDVGIALLSLIAAVISGFVSYRYCKTPGSRFRGGNHREPKRDSTRDHASSPEQSPASPRKKRRRMLVPVFGVVALAVVLTALLFWLQRPQRVNEPNIAATSPDGMYDAMGQTWHTMRIFGGDRTFYRFRIQGKAGAVWEKWDVEVPYDKLATSYVLLSRDEILFGKHGRIGWSGDGKRASFRVNGVEVAGFDTETGKPTEPAEADHTPKQVAREFMDAMREQDIDRALPLMVTKIRQGDRMREFWSHCAVMFAEKYAADLERLTMFTGWHREGDYAVTSIAPPSANERTWFLILQQTPGGWRVAHVDDMSADASMADRLERFKRDLEREKHPQPPPASILVEEAALHLLVAIREKDEAGMRALCTDRIKGWTDALVGHFSMELRERFRQSTGEEFALYPGESRVDGELAVVKCRGANDVQKKLNGNILVLHFCRTGSGWKLWTLHKAMDAQPIEEHLEQARKWAAEWKTAELVPMGAGENTPEQAARAFMEALRTGDIDAVMEQMAPEMKAQVRIRKAMEGLSGELREVYAGKLDRFTEFTEWYPPNRDANTRFVGTRIAGVPADDGSEREHSLYLVLSPTPEGWKVAHLDDAFSDKPLSHYVDRIVRIIPGEGPEFRAVPVGGETAAVIPNDDPAKRVKVLPVTPPATVPEGFSLTVKQVSKVLDGVTWGEFLAAFADDGRGGEVSWKEAKPEDGSGRRFEISFAFGGEEMLIDLEADPEFRRATPSRLRSANHPDQVLADPARFLPLMVMRYATQSGHPAAAPAVAIAREKAFEKARQARDLSAMREYAVGLVTCLADIGTLPPDLQTLVAKKYLREAALMMNYETGKMQMPLYHGSPDLRVQALDASAYIVLAARSADQSGKRAVGFLDSHVEMIEEADYLKQLKAQQKPPMEPTVDDSPE